MAPVLELEGRATADQTGDARAPPARWSLALVLLLALALQLPTLGVGFFVDDYLHQLVLEDDAGLFSTPRWNLYDFRGAPEWEAFGRERGGPWWASPDWKVRFFRPLSSLSIALCHSVFGRWAPGYHATSLGLWLALLVLVHRLFLALGLAPRIALAGLLVFALSDASSIPVGWIANQNSLWEALCAVGALLCALRPGAGVPAAAAALGLAAAAALGKESGALAFPMLACTWLALRSRAPDAERRRLTGAALAALLLFAGYLTFLALAGYGTRSLFYATPWTDPTRYLGNLALLAGGGVLTSLVPIPLDVVMLFPAVRWPLFAAGIVAGVALAPAVARALRGRERAGLLLLWAVLFLAPQGGVVPSERLLLVPSIGIAGLLALTWSAERAAWASASWTRRVLARALALSVLLGSGALLAVQNSALADMARHVRTKILATEVGARELGQRDVLVLQAENEMQAFALGPTWHAEHDDPLVRFWLLQGGPRALRWTRVDERAFELETLDEAFLTGPFEAVYRSTELPPALGSRCQTPLFTVHPLEIGRGGLRRFRVTLERSLDDPAVLFVRPVEGVLTRIEPPAPGATIVLERARSTRPFTP